MGLPKRKFSNTRLICEVDKNIVFTGFVERKRLKEFSMSQDVFVFASKVESQGMVTLEFIAFGKPE